MARNRVIQEGAWTAERVRAWRAAQDFGGASGAALSSSSRVRRVDVS